MPVAFVSGMGANKFNARKVKDDGYTFDSKAEHRRYGNLKLLQRAGKIKDLKVHPRFQLWGVNGSKVGRYTADFQYVELGQCGQELGTVVEDVKSPITAKQSDYVLRKKLFIDNYPKHEFREVKG